MESIEADKILLEKDYTKRDQMIDALSESDAKEFLKLCMEFLVKR